MIIKQRFESPELKLLRSLNARMNLPVRETQSYLNLEKGFKGEKKFDEYLECLSDNWIILNDLLFESHNTLFQIDTMLISQDTVYLFEVKNYEGDFFIEADKWYALPKTEIQNPLLQLKRSESLLRRLLQDLGINTSIEAFVVFINPEFTLYQAPLRLPIIFPTQLNRFIDKIKLKSPKLDKRHHIFANQLLSHHLKVSPYTRIPDYSYHELKKGIICQNCHSILASRKEEILICSVCGCKENFDAAVLRSIDEYLILFPHEKITTNTIQEWCNVNGSKKSFRRILFKNFTSVGWGKSSYYVKSEENTYNNLSN